MITTDLIRTCTLPRMTAIITIENMTKLRFNNKDDQTISYPNDVHIAYLEVYLKVLFLVALIDKLYSKFI